MPEGPSIVILKEAVQEFKAQKIISITGNSKQDIQRLSGEYIIDFKSWGKHFLICFKNFAVRIHFMLFGSYSINQKIETKVTRLGIHLENGDLYFYACSVQFIEEDVNNVYNWTADVMNNEWSASKAKKKLKERPVIMLCDALLDQHIFAGVGNIIKNEVCYRIRVHPESKVGALPLKQINDLVKEARNYSFDFLEWKKNYVLKKHWLAHTKKICQRCNLPIEKNMRVKLKEELFSVQIARCCIIKSFTL